MAKRPFTIIHQDADIVICNKASGVLSIPGRDPKQLSLQELLKRKLKADIFIVHRLDKDTSGIICYAKNEIAHKNLCEQFEKREVKKKYLALVSGTPNPAEGKVENFLSPHIKGYMKVSTTGKRAVSMYKTLKSYDQISLMEIEILTGRMHQIRVHMRSIGHPLIVDKIYGKRSELFLSEFSQKPLYRSKYKSERPLISRHSLHAHSLTFTHPDTQKKIKFECDLAKDMKAVIHQLERNKS